METQKIINLLNKTDYQDSKYATKNWHVINDETNGNYGSGDIDNTFRGFNPIPIKFITKSLESYLCDYSDAYILVTGKVKINTDAATKMAFKNCAPFINYRVEINDTQVEYANNLNVIMPMYSLLEYSDNFSESTSTLQNFIRDENDRYNVITVNDSKSYNYKYVATEDDGIKNDLKIAVPVKYFTHFFRSLEMSLINCKLVIDLNWEKIMHINYNCFK